MNNRGPDRGTLQQAVPPPRRRGQPPWQRPSPGQPVRPGPEPDAAWRPRRDAPAYRPPSSADIRATVPVTRIPAPVQRQPGGVALDSLEDQDTEVRSTFSRRRLLSRLTRINLGHGKDRAYELRLRDRVRASAGSAFPIAVLNLKGGVGKTAVVEVLGSTFADVRDDRVIAVDVDAGDLADRHGRRDTPSMADLVADRSVTRYLDVRAHTYQNRSGLEALGLPDYAHSVWRIVRDDVLKVLSILGNHYSVMLMDCGKALKSDVVEAVLRESRALVVVTNASIDAIRKARTTLEWLANNGYLKLGEGTVLAINHTEQGKPNALANKELRQLSEQFPSNRVVVLPFDQHVHEGKEIILERLSKQSRRRYLELAAALADTFPRRGAGKR